MNRHILDNLSKELSQQERKDLLKKIKESVTSRSISKLESPSNIDTDEDRQIQLLRKEYQNASGIAKLIFLLLSVLTGRSVEKVILSRRLSAIKRSILRRGPFLTGATGRGVGARFAERVFEQFREILPVRDIYRTLWLVEGVFERFLLDVVEHNVSEGIVTLSNLHSLEEMVTIYGDSENIDALRQRVVDTLRKKIESLPKEEFAQLDNSLSIFHYPKDIVLFPYGSFFAEFEYDIEKTEMSGTPTFSKTNGFKIIGYLEKMGVALNAARHLNSNCTVERDTIASLIRIHETKKNSSRTSNLGTDLTDTDEKLVSDQLKKLYSRVIEFEKSLPVLDMIRYLRSDPFYLPADKTIELDSRELYYIVIKDYILREFDDLKPSILKGHQQRLMEGLFATNPMLKLSNYVQHSNQFYKDLGVAELEHVGTINLLYSYFHHYNSIYYQPLFSILEKGALSGNPLLVEEVGRYSTSFGSIERSLMELDRSLSPNSSDGALYAKLLDTAEENSPIVGVLSTLVAQKSRDAKLIVVSAKESIKGLIELFDKIVDAEASNVKMQLEAHYFIGGETIQLHRLILFRRDHLIKFRELLGQQELYESTNR